ncbi:aminoglycoside phosphotransferase family protein [Actinomadura nitritigenes]|uniref:Aminoglycoside phosphotransferase family protein n=1 Tax=Actinomadura nitritigenes TaxID=134602 RepID=A0ABS3RAY2_9ACTN|nr:aminoglycoside phosphotransferase family protein [Actinomadura nitritigenes]MBO2443400.1 aminoglycoside phosphotransferase family protein [Actinomadura nitritigenes]
MVSEDVLQDGPHRKVVRVGDTVRRPVQPWTATVHALLEHLEAVGFPYAPRPLGVDEQGREVLTFIDGDSGPQGWAKVADDRGLSVFARLLRDYHDATVGFSPPEQAVWASGPSALGEGQVVCHGDFGPWNVVWRGDHPVGIIDWDFVGPAPRLHDVAYALQYVAPFRDDAECLRWLHFPQVPDRRRRLERFCTAYGLTTPLGIVDAVIDRQRQNIDLVRRLASQGHEPQATWVREGLLEELDRRLAWSRSNRHLFE